MAQYDNALYALIRQLAIFVCSTGLLASARYHLTALDHPWYLPTIALLAPPLAEPCQCQKLGQNWTTVRKSVKYYWYLFPMFFYFIKFHLL